MLGLSDVTVPMAGTANGINTLGLLVFSVFFGSILGSMEAEGKPLRDFFDCLNKAIMRLVSIVIWLVWNNDSFHTVASNKGKLGLKLCNSGETALI